MTTQKSELQILLPGHDVTLSDGRVVHVRALTFGEGVALQGKPGASEFFAELHEGVAPGESPDPFAMLELGTRHVAFWFAFLAAVTGLTAEELGALGVVDGTRLAVEAVAENGSFFGAAVMLARARHRGSPTPSRSSSDTATPVPQT